MVVNCRNNLFLVDDFGILWLFVLKDGNLHGWCLPFLLHFPRLWKKRTHYTLSICETHRIASLHDTGVLCWDIIRRKRGAQVRFIKEVPVFAVTATFSVLAYLWLLIIVSWSCGVVDSDFWKGHFSGSFSRILEHKKRGTPQKPQKLQDWPKFQDYSMFWGKNNSRITMLIATFNENHKILEV